MFPAPQFPPSKHHFHLLQLVSGNFLQIRFRPTDCSALGHHLEMVCKWMWNLCLARGKSKGASASSSRKFSLPEEDVELLVVVVVVISRRRNCFLCFMRRFWNHVFTCVSLRPNADANSTRSGVDRYLLIGSVEKSRF